MRTTMWLCVWLVVVYAVIIVFAIPAVVPGHTNCFAVMVGIACLFAGAWSLGRQCSRLPLFFFYGCIGGATSIPLFYSERRPMLAYALNPNLPPKAYDWAFVVTCFVCIVMAGVACRLVAAASYAREKSKRNSSEHCRECGYLLIGLPEPRCPECGTPFDSDKVGRVGCDSSHLL